MATKSETEKIVEPNDINIYSVRTAIEDLKETEELIETDVPVDPDIEFAAIQKRLDGGPALLFNTIDGWPHARFLTNLFAQRSRIDRMFGFDGQVDRTRQIADAVNNPIEPVVVDSEDAPVHETVNTDFTDVDDIITPIRHTKKEPELTTGTGNSVVYGKYFEGGSHIGYNRMNFRWGDVGTFQAAPGGHMWMIQKEYYGEKIPITMNFGVPPAATLAAGAGFDYVVLPKGTDELGLAGAVQDAPIELVETQTVDDAYAIANAEYTIEGYLDPTDRRYETQEAEEAEEQGKHAFHPEWAGYMGKSYKAPTFHVTAVTHRSFESQPIIMPLIVHSMDDSNIDTTVREAAFFELADRIQPDIVSDVHIPYSMTDWGGVIFQIDKQNSVDEGYHRNFLVSAMGTSRGLRLAFAVDTDVNIYDMDDIMWALTTRVNPETDVLNPVPGGAGQAFQPSERATAGGEDWTQSHTEFEGGMAIDATVPYGMEDQFERPQYAIEEAQDLTEWFSEEEVDRAKESQEGWVKLLRETGW
jgi:4-hydroxy-3-polyprenylbenzoate decarboxylase